MNPERLQKFFNNIFELAKYDWERKDYYSILEKYKILILRLEEAIEKLKVLIDIEEQKKMEEAKKEAKELLEKIRK